MTLRERRAYRLGFLRAMRRARRELDEMREHLDDEIAALDDKMRTAHQQTVQQIGDEFVELMVEMEGMKNEYRRWQAVERAIDTERDPDALLN